MKILNSTSRVNITWCTRCLVTTKISWNLTKWFDIGQGTLDSIKLVIVDQSVSNGLYITTMYISRITKVNKEYVVSFLRLIVALYCTTIPPYEGKERQGINS